MPYCDRCETPVVDAAAHAAWHRANDRADSATRAEANRRRALDNLAAYRDANRQDHARV